MKWQESQNLMVHINLYHSKVNNIQKIYNNNKTIKVSFSNIVNLKSHKQKFWDQILMT